MTKKPPGDRDSEPERKPAKKPVVLQIRGAPEYKKVLEELVEFDGLDSVASLVDRAVRHYARHIGFAKHFPKR